MTKTATYYVLDGHTLGYVYEDAMPGWFHILRASVLRGSTLDPLGGAIPIGELCALGHAQGRARIRPMGKDRPQPRAKEVRRQVSPAPF